MSNLLNLLPWLLVCGGIINNCPLSRLLGLSYAIKLNLSSERTRLIESGSHPKVVRCVGLRLCKAHGTDASNNRFQDSFMWFWFRLLWFWFWLSMCLLSFDLYANSHLVFPRKEWRGEVVGVVITTGKWEGAREVATRTTEEQAWDRITIQPMLNH